MLKSTKGNLLCYQWEVERFQRSHREKMAAVAPHQSNNKPASLPRHRGGLRKTAKVDAKRQNALPIAERTSRVHGTGGCQWRSLHESQGVKTVLEFGKTSEALSRAANKHRASLRKRKQECVRRENAKLFTRLATPCRSGIDFNKFEAEFSESRARHRMIHCDRTVGHKLVFSAIHAREPPCPGEEPAATVCLRTRRRKQPHRRKEPINAETSAPAWETVACGPQEDPDAHHARRLFSTRCPPSAVLSPRRPPGDLGIQGADGNGSRYDEPHNNAFVAANKGGEAEANACGGAQAPCGYRHRSGANRPHTALGLRGARDQPDLLEARAADPGWGSTGVYSAARPLSAPARDSRRGWNKAEASCARQSSPLTPAGKGVRTYRPKSVTNNERRNLHGAQKGESTPEDGSEHPKDRCFFGRTLLAEAKILVDGNAKKNVRCRTTVVLKCSSLDGLMRQQGRVRKTLQGFVVEASIATRPHSAGENADRVSSSSVAVSAVQDLLEQASASKPLEKNLAPFREAPPLDDRGNYPELTALMGKAGQRDLYQTLLGSCRVVTAVDGAISVEFLQTNTGLGMSASVGTPGVGSQHANFPRPRRPESAQRGEFLPTGTGDEIYRAQAVRRSGRGGSGHRNSGTKKCHGEVSGSNGGVSASLCISSSEEQEEAEEPPAAVAAQSPAAPQNPREAVVEHTSESEVYSTLPDEEVELEEDEEAREEREKAAKEEGEEGEEEDGDDEQRYDSDFS